MSGPLQVLFTADSLAGQAQRVGSTKRTAASLALGHRQLLSGWGATAAESARPWTAGLRAPAHAPRGSRSNAEAEAGQSKRRGRQEGPSPAHRPRSLFPLSLRFTTPPQAAASPLASKAHSQASGRGLLAASGLPSSRSYSGLLQQRAPPTASTPSIVLPLPQVSPTCAEDGSPAARQATSHTTTKEKTGAKRFR